jgi:hypothetical protein
MTEGALTATNSATRGRQKRQKQRCSFVSVLVSFGRHFASYFWSRYSFRIRLRVDLETWALWRLTRLLCDILGNRQTKRIK